MTEIKRTFDIRIPKEFLRENTPDWDKLDFKFFVTVHYWFNEERKIVFSVEVLFDLAEFLKWEHPFYKKYLLAACENNHLNTLEGMANPELHECIN